MTAVATQSADRIEAGLGEMWERMLRISPIGRDDDFFDLGGDSVQAVEMLIAIEERFGVDLPISTLANGITLAELGALVERGGINSERAEPVGDDRSSAEADLATTTPSPVLVPLRTAGSKPPLFLVHGVALPTLRHQFLDGLDAEQPVYLFQHRGLDGGSQPNRTIEAMARDYIDAMRGARPSSPYFIGGFCAGGFVALEMAYQLAQRDIPVPTLVFVDPPQIFHAVRGLRAIPWYASRAVRFVWRTSFRAVSGYRRRLVRLNARRIDARKESRVAAEKQGDVRLDAAVLAQRNFNRALRHYRPKPYHGALHLICPAGPEPPEQKIRLFWKRAYDDVTLHVVGKNHWTMYRDDLDEIARQAQGAIDGIAA